MYRLYLPSDCQPKDRLRINGRFWLAVALSVLAHVLFYLVFRQQPVTPSKPPQAGQRIEISLSTLSKSAAKPTSKPTEDLSDAKPVEIPYRKPLEKITVPKPVELPPLKPLEKLPKPKPVKLPKPPRPRPEPQPLPVPRPEPPPKPEPEPTPEPPPQPEPPPVPKPAPPLPKPVANEEPVPDFKDDFQQLSKAFKPGSPDSRSLEPSRSTSMQPDNGVHPGSILNINPRIIYPLNAMRRGMTGKVVVLIHISTDGHTDGVDLIKSSGHEELDNQVLGAVQHWRFNPPRRGSMPVEGTYKHTVIFGANEEVIDDFATHWREVKLMPAQ